MPLILALRKQMQADLCANLVYKSEFQDSQGFYTKKSCVEGKRKKKNILINTCKSVLESHKAIYVISQKCSSWDYGSVESVQQIPNTAKLKDEEVRWLRGKALVNKSQVQQDKRNSHVLSVTWLILC